MFCIPGKFVTSRGWSIGSSLAEVTRSTLACDLTFLAVHADWASVTLFGPRQEIGAALHKLFACIRTTWAQNWSRRSFWAVVLKRARVPESFNRSFWTVIFCRTRLAAVAPSDVLVSTRQTRHFYFGAFWAHMPYWAFIACRRSGCNFLD